MAGVVNITKHQDPERVFRNALKPNANPRGTIITYGEGNFGDEIGLTTIGKLAWDAYERGEVELVQKKIGFERHLYMAVVK